MCEERILVVPGAASPLSEEYRPVYALIEDEARRTGNEVLTVMFPGQSRHGRVSLRTAVDSTLSVWRSFKPTWVIARSFGCAVASELLSHRDSIRSVKGAVFWGPVLSAWVKRFLPTSELKKQEIAGYRERGTHLDRNFFNDFYAMEVLVTGVRANVRFARGARDKYNSREDLEYLAALHRHSQPSATQEVVEVPSFGHSVASQNRSNPAVTAYLKVLFSPFRSLVI